MSSGLLSAREENLPVTTLFSKQEIVGKGAYGAVYKGIHNGTGTVVALKIINLDADDNDDIAEIQREVALLSSLRDAERNNCTSYHGCWLHKTQLWLAMDFAAGGSIRTILKATTNLEERHIALVMRETLVALVYLHKQGIIHRDIKAANILLTHAGRIVLADFGVAAALLHSNKRSTFTGTPYWMAPEVIADGKLYDTKADIWSLGVTCFECATGNPPFAQYEALRAIQLIPKNPPAKLDAAQSWTQPMRDFLAFCLTEDPNDRLTADDLLKTKWIKAFAKTPVSNLKELISKYSVWVSGGGIRNSIIGLDSPATDNSQEWGPESSWDYSPMVDGGVPTYKGSNLGTDAPDTYKTAKPASNAQRNHPLMRLFEDENAPALNAATAAKAYGLGFSLSDGPRPAQPQPLARPSISIPDFGDGSEEDDAAATLRSTRRPKAIPEPATLRPDLQQIPRSSQSHSLSSTTPAFRARSSSQLDVNRRPSSPPPPSPSLPHHPSSLSGPSNRGPVSSSPSLPSLSLPRSGDARSQRNRSNTAPVQEGMQSFASSQAAEAMPTSVPNGMLTASVVTASPPSIRPLIRRDRSGTLSSDSASVHTRKTSVSSSASPTDTRIADVPPPLPSPGFAHPMVPMSQKATGPIPWPDTRPIRPLDYSALVAAADVHGQLEQTVHDLQLWLSRLDGGLGQILMRA